MGIYTWSSIGKLLTYHPVTVMIYEFNKLSIHYVIPNLLNHIQIKHHDDNFNNSIYLRVMRKY